MSVAAEQALGRIVRKAEQLHGYLEGRPGVILRARRAACEIVWPKRSDDRSGAKPILHL